MCQRRDSYGKDEVPRRKPITTKRNGFVEEETGGDEEETDCVRRRGINCAKEETSCSEEETGSVEEKNNCGEDDIRNFLVDDSPERRWMNRGRNSRMSRTLLCGPSGLSLVSTPQHSRIFFSFFGHGLFPRINSASYSHHLHDNAANFTTCF